MPAIDTARPLHRHDPIACERCAQVIFDGEVFKTRVIRLRPGGGTEAKCRSCKGWVALPLVMGHNRTR